MSCTFDSTLCYQDSGKVTKIEELCIQGNSPVSVINKQK